MLHCGEINLSQCHSELVSGCQAECTVKYPLFSSEGEAIQPIFNSKFVNESTSSQPSPQGEGESSYAEGIGKKPCESLEILRLNPVDLLQSNGLSLRMTGLFDNSDQCRHPEQSEGSLTKGVGVNPSPQSSPKGEEVVGGLCHAELVSASLAGQLGEFPSPMEEGVGEMVLPFAMLAVNDIIKKCAFTLAEVLITLGIIGVVAAITIPSLMAATQEASLVPKVKKTYSTLAQALKLASNDYDTPGDFSLIFEEGKSASQITKELATYINGARYCDAGSSAKGCSDLNYKIKYASLIKNGDSNTAAQSSKIINSPRIVLMDGTVIAITTQGRGCGDYEASGAILNNGVNTGNMWHQIRSNCGEIFFDVNGPKRPNQFGVDAYGINVYQNSLGFNYWSVYGTASLRNILNNVKHPFKYSKYSDSQEFEW